VLQGEFPDSMKRFWTFLLNKNLPLDSLKGVGTAVFGLGDSGLAPNHIYAQLALL
jgi:sulfite reductase alpha subunit-like flavoprotein